MTQSPSADPQPSAAAEAAASPDHPGQGIAGFLRSFWELRRLPRAFWLINLAFALDGFAYFGIIALLGPFLTEVVGVPDKYATMIIGAFAAAVSLFMFGFGSFAERFGIRRALLGSFVVMLTGRLLICIAPQLGGAGGQFAVVVAAACAGLFIIAVGEGVEQTANYSGLKQYCDEKTSALAFGFNYAILNAGIVLAGLISPEIRVRVDNAARAIQAGQAVGDDIWRRIAAWTGNGMVAVFWLCAAVTFLTLIAGLLTFTRRAEANKLRPESEDRIIRQRAVDADLGWWHRLRTGPFGNPRFTFFVFILLPARTLFAHQIHTIGIYIMRCYDKPVQDRMEYFSNLVNPLIVAAFAPICSALFWRMSVLRLMLIGTLVTALPTFLLCFGQRWDLLLAYSILFSIGEALWQPRFYEFAANLAPEGKMGAYMAAANVPWLMAKFGVGLYAGWMLSIYCPTNGPQQPGTLWAIHGAIAMISPIGLWLAWDWLKAGIHPPAAKA